MKIPSPFLPVEVTTENLEHTVRLLGRTYTLGADSMPNSIKVNGNEILSAPIRIVMREDGEESVWDTDYQNNESESFIFSRSDEGVVICGSMRSERFVINTCFRIEYDGCMAVDLKLMARGGTVAQAFGLEAVKPRKYIVDSMWLEIPLKKEFVELYNIEPEREIFFEDGTKKDAAYLNFAGKLPKQSFSLGFMPTVWLGSEKAGFGFFTESNRYWQTADENKTYEIINRGDEVILRVHILDSNPIPWSDDKEYDKPHLLYPICFRFGFQTTPVKPFPKNSYPIRGLHLDCFIKTPGNYRDFLDDKNRFDRLVEKGVDTLVLHEKWNKLQNSFELSEYTREQIKYIVSECHKRGIKVLTYFGYEMSSLHPDYMDARHGNAVKVNSGLELGKLNGEFTGSWFRVPYQRDCVCCYGSDEWADRFINGITEVMDTCHIDGVYLDGTAQAWKCTNTDHGCGWYDYDGKLQGSHSIFATRKLFKRLYDAVESRGGIINLHASGYGKFYALPFVHLCWHGEDLQAIFMHKNLDEMPIDALRAAYTGRTMGVPVELISYEKRPTWTIEHALALAGIHGVLPRPNDIEHPLDLIADVWKIYNTFPMESSDFVPYWDSDITVSDERVKVSYYRYTAYDGSKQLLAFCTNVTKEAVDNVKVNFGDEFTKVIDATNGNADCIGGMSFDALGYRILFVR